MPPAAGDLLHSGAVRPHGHPLRGKVLVAYIVLCVVWGATFLAIRVGVQHFPPALFAGTRFLAAGLTLLAVALTLRQPFPRLPIEWGRTVLVGVLMLVCGNGMVTWGSQFFPSNKTAVFMVTGPLWSALFDSVWPGGTSRPGWNQITGLLVGFSGALMLVGGNEDGFRQVDWRGPAALFVANMSWALGGVYWKRHPVGASPYITAALHMTIGGAILMTIGLVTGEADRFAFSVPGVVSVLYLIVFGSVLGYSCFVYVLKHTSPTLTSTYIYLNTVVAVLLGWAVLGEAITGRMLVAMAVILGSVVWVQRQQGHRSSV